MRYVKGTTIILIISLLILTQAHLNASSSSKSEKSMPWLFLLLADDTRTITLSGQASLPGYTPAGRLWMIVYSVDGRIYNLGASDIKGNFNLKATIPTDVEYLLLYAIDPNDPEHHAIAFVDVRKPVAAAPLEVAKNKTPYITPVDARSTAHTYVSLTSGLHPAEAESLYRNEIEALANTYLTTPPSLCSVEQSPAVNVPRKIISTVYNGYGTLLERVRMAQREVSTKVASGNYILPTIFTGGLSGFANFGVLWTRFILYNKLGGDWGLGGSINPYMTSINVQDLATAYTIITNENGYTWGFGNCMEKGIAGAYIATRFEEFQAIAYVGAEIKGHFYSHGFAIACRKVWDMQNLMDFDTEGIPEELFKSDCMIIDPWNDFTWNATPEAVNSWSSIVAVIEIKKNGGTKLARSEPKKATPNNGFGGAHTSQSCEGFCEPCLPYSAIAAKTCKPFIIPVTGTEKKYYLFKRSGTGYRKRWGGGSEKMTGYDYFYQFISPSEAEEVKANFSKFPEANAIACEHGPPICPCAPYPDIWETGKIEVVDVFDTADDLSPYRCPNPHWGPHYLICNMWNTNSEPYPGYWPDIERICGETP